MGVSEAQFGDLLEEVTRIENYQGFVSRLWGFFTLINVVWFAAVVGIAVSIGPTFWELSKPIREYLRVIFTWFAKRIKRYVFFLVKIRFFLAWVQPGLLRLHNWGVWEAGCYWFSMMLVAQGFRIDDPQHGKMVQIFF